jgi:uncharacterized protein (DUF1330 family)
MGFLLFLAVLLLAFAVVGYVLGPNMLAFVFHDERRTAPVVMVDLLDFADTQAEQRHRDAYSKPARPMITALGGHLLWSARADEVVRGRTVDGWSWLMLTEYPSRSAVIELVTSSDYRALLSARHAALERFAVLAATPLTTFPDADSQAGAHAVRLLAGVRDDSIERYQTEWATQDEDLLGRHRGHVVWRARLDPFSGDAAQHFDVMLVYGFPDIAHRDAWVDDPARETLQALQRRLFLRDVLLLARADADAP